MEPASSHSTKQKLTPEVAQHGRGRKLKKYKLMALAEVQNKEVVRITMAIMLDTARRAGEEKGC